MSKVSNDMSSLCSNASDLTSGIKDMLCEIDNGRNAALQRSSCFTRGIPQHLAKNVHQDYQEAQRESCSIKRQPAKSQRDDEVGQILTQVKNGKKLGGQKSKCDAISAAGNW